MSKGGWVREMRKEDVFGREERVGQLGMREEEARVKCRWFYTTPIKGRSRPSWGEICWRQHGASRAPRPSCCALQFDRLRLGKQLKSDALG